MGKNSISCSDGGKQTLFNVHMGKNSNISCSYGDNNSVYCSDGEQKIEFTAQLGNNNSI